MTFHFQWTPHHFQHFQFQHMGLELLHPRSISAAFLTITRPTTKVNFIFVIIDQNNINYCSFSFDFYCSIYCLTASPNKNLRNMQSRSPSRTHLFRDNTVPPNTSFTTLTTEGGSSHAGFDSVSTKADIVRGAAEAASASSVTLPSEQQCSRQRRAGAGQSEGQRDKPANQCRPTPVLSDYSRPLAGVAGSGANTEQSADSTSRSLLRSPGRTPSIMQLLLDTPSHAQLQKNRNVMGKVATALQSLNSPKKTKSESKRKASSQQSKLNEPKKPKISPLTETSG
jgi:hypothetical protein